MDSFLQIANSPILFIICLIPIAVAIYQVGGFYRLAAQEAKDLDMPKDTIKKVAVNSILVSIVPMVPVIITLSVLMALLGKYIPWLRLSVMGSMAYESFAADLTIQAFGLGRLGEALITPEAFVGAVWVMTLAVMVAPVENILFLKTYDRKLKTFREKGGFLAIASGSMLLGLLALLFMPDMVNVAQPLGIITGVVAGISVLLLDYLAQKKGNKILGQFSFPLSMIAGMAAAVFASNII